MLKQTSVASCFCSETYEYYKLPYCKPKDGVKYKTLGMGEVRAALLLCCSAAAAPITVLQWWKFTSCHVDVSCAFPCPRPSPHTQVVDANRMATLPYNLSFLAERKNEVVCSVTLDDEDMMKFRRVSSHLWWAIDLCACSI